jgi:hypothetical protein
MKPKESFALVIRILGLCGFCYVLRHLVQDVVRPDFALGVFYLVVKAVYLAVGLYLVRGAPLLANFAYPEESRPASTSGA